MWWAWLLACGDGGAEPPPADGAETDADADADSDSDADTDADADTDTDTDTPPGAITWHRDVRPLSERHCEGCHTPGGVAPFDFSDPDQVAVLGPAMVDAVLTRSMPPYDFLPGCRDVEGSLLLDDPTLDTFRAWAADGYLLGDPADHVPAELPQPIDPPPPDLVVRPIRPMVPDLSQPDDYQCLISGTAFPRDTFVTWSEIFPERLDLVHHVIVYAVPPELLGDLTDLAGGDLEAQFDCWESPVTYLGTTVSIWAPGPSPTFEDTTDAMLVPAGSRLVFEVHYNTLVSDGGGDATDLSEIRLWTLPESDVTHLRVKWTAYDEGIQIPAGDPAVRTSINVRLPVNAPLIRSSPHQHLLGTGVRTDVRRPDGSSACVSDVAWDFDWQREYPVPADQWIPFSTTAGDSLDLSCAYDNSAANQPIVDGVRQEPADVEWGDGSLAEMCTDFLTFRVPFDPAASRGLCAGFDACYRACDPDDPECPLVCMGQAGEACYSCGVVAMVGPCTSLRCPLPVASLAACLMDCEDVESDFHGCLVEECGAELARYHTCAEPLFREGTCASDYDECSGLVP